jgi:dsDNA-binding SOS-regulon protein
MKFKKYSMEVNRHQNAMYSLGPSYEADESWKVLDSNGHLHAWLGKELPTLKKVIDQGAVELYDDYVPEESHYECVLCGEHIEPALKRMGNYRTPVYVDGPITYLLTADDKAAFISKEQADAFVEAVKNKRNVDKELEELFETIFVE